MAATQRVEYIDLAKGLCISLVVLIHIHDFETTTETALRFFRMPLYYFLSGIFFKEYSGLKEFSIKKLNKLIISYLFFFLVAYAAGIVCHFLHLYEKGILEEPFRWNMIGDIIFKLGRGEDIGYNQPIWFLLSLFGVNILFFLLHYWIRNKWWLLAVCFLIGGSMICAWSVTERWPYYFDRSLAALPFFAVGFYAKNWILQDKFARQIIPLYKSLLLCAGCFAFIYGCALFPKEVRDLFPIHYSAGFAGILLLLTICRILKRLPVISYIGRYSLVVLGFHTFLVAPLRFVFSFAGEAGQYILTYVAIALLMRYVVIPVSIKIFPYFVAQKDLIRVEIVDSCFRSSPETQNICGNNSGKF